MRLKMLKRVFLAGAAAVVAAAQIAVRFEVASLKPAATREAGGVHTYPGGRVGLRGCTLSYMIQQAFDLQPFQVTGGPDWMESERYDVDAKVPEGSKSIGSMPAYSKVPMNAEQRQMLASLLVERFALQYRHESREGPVYLLVRGKGKLKLAESKDKNEYPWAGGPAGGAIMGDGLKGTNESMGDLAKRLSRYFEHPVIDRTGLAGSFDFLSEYKPDEERPDIPAMIRACIQDLGLQLQAAKAPVETIVVTHAEKPTAN